MGYLPAWYTVLRAARYLGVAPWELEERSPKWFFQAQIAERAEAMIEQPQE